MTVQGASCLGGPDVAAPNPQPRNHSLHDGSESVEPDRASQLRARRDACRLESLGTTAKRECWQEKSEWVSDMEYVWRARMTGPRELLEERAAERYRQADLCTTNPQHRVELLRSAEWAEHRARALAMARTDIVDSCRKRWRKVACKCGTKEILVGCDAPQLCSWCRKRHWRKWRHRITRSMDAHVRAARGAWNRHRRGMLPGVYLITLTGPHSGDLAVDRVTMGRALRKLLKHAEANRWWTAYALTWETTPGGDNRGHMHVHLAVVSSWIPYASTPRGGDSPFARWEAERDEVGLGRIGLGRIGIKRKHRGKRLRRRMRGLHEVWRDAMPGALVLDVRAPNGSRNQAGRAANYLAKYVTKGVDPVEFTGRKAGELLVAFRGRRKVSASRRFWMPEDKVCRVCNCYHRNVGSPCALQDIAPGAVLRAMAERTRYRDDSRMNPQVDLRWDSA